MSDKISFNNFFKNIRNIGFNLTAYQKNNKHKIVLFDNSPQNTSWVNFSQKPEDTIPPERRKELEEWTLDYDFYVDRTGFEYTEYYKNSNDDEKEEKLCDRAYRNHKDVAEIYSTWYQNYLNTHNGIEMNFLSARQYLKDNPDEKPEIKEFIKRCFGICDGNVSNNKQMGLGVCVLLSAREKMEDETILNDKVKNIVKQNDDGTVTVTLFGLRIKNENNEYEPMQFTLKNEEIKESYTILNNENEYVGGPTDPDDAALVIAFRKLAEFLNKEYPIKSKEEIEKYYDNKKKEALDLQSEILNKLNDETGRLYSYLLEKEAELKETGNVPNLMGKMDDAKNCSEHGWPFISGILENPETYFDEIKSLNMGIDIENLKKLFNDRKNALDGMNNFEKAKKEEINRNLYKKLMYSDLYAFPEDGIPPSLALTILTGMGDNIKSYEYEDDGEIKKYFESIDYNVKNKCIIAYKKSGFENADLLFAHEYMIKDIYEDEDGNKYITFKNPHNEIYDYEEEDTSPTENMVSGNLGTTFTLKLDETLLNNLNITVISDEPVEDQKPFYRIPDDFTLKNTVVIVLD